MEVVILAGGLGTRLYPITRAIPKSMVPVLGKPFLEHQVALLHRQGVDDLVILIGHMGSMITDYFGDGSRFGVRIRYGNEGDRLLDTAGAVRQALPFLAAEFFLIFGDSYLVLPYRKIWDDYHASGRASLMVVYRNENKYDTSDIFVEDGLVRSYQKTPPLPEAFYINDGLMIVRREDIAAIPEGRRMSLQEFFQPIIARGQLAAWETTQRFYEIGSHAGLKDFEQHLAAGSIAP
jgi:NDP-sugar pyrophosphorylase family protein